jgi:hypothetical protein
MVSLMIRHSIIFSQAESTKPLIRQSQLESVTKNIATFIGAKTKQVTITIKIHDRVVQRFKSSIICAMKVGEKFGVTSPGIGVALKPKFGTQVQRVGLVT